MNPGTVADISPFQPHPLIKNPHLQTICARYLPGATPRAGKLHKIECGDGDILTLLENKPSRKTAFKKAIVLMHGLTGDAESPYMLRMAALLSRRGWTVFRMNHRGCGVGAGLAKSTYHSGKSDDVARAINRTASLCPGFPMIAVGFSLSGNALLKTVGQGIEKLPDNLQGTIAVTPPIDLSLCAKELSRPSRRIYDYRFVRQLKEAIEDRKAQFPGFPNFQFPFNTTVRDFDEICTAPLHGFDSAEDYYKKCSAKQFLRDIRLPTVVLASLDDPFVPRHTFQGLPQSSNIKYCLTEQGGHMGYISAKPTPLGDRRWMDYAILRFAEQLLEALRSKSINP